MPELPEVTVYVERLQAHFAGQVLQRVRLAHPFLLRTAEPPLEVFHGRRVLAFRRLGKRIVFHLEPDYFLVLHLMIAGRLRLRPAGTAIPKKVGLAAFDFGKATVLLTEAGSRKRAALHALQGEASLAPLDAGGLEVLEASYEAFRERLLSQNHTLKRALTDPRLFSGIGNAYSDEILHQAGLSPVQWTSRLDETQIRRLYEAARSTLQWWIQRLRDEVGEGFPENVTAFRPEMAVHGKFGRPCPRCGTPVQRIRYADNETNYCPQCQTGGKVLADRALSRLLKKDWPRRLEDLEEIQPLPRRKD